MAKAAGSAAASGSMNNIMKAAVQKRMADRFGGDGSLVQSSKNLMNSPEIIRKGVTDRLASLTDPKTYTDAMSVSLEPVRLTKNLFNKDDRTFGERGYDLYQNRLEEKFGADRRPFADMADNRNTISNNQSQENMILDSIQNQFDENKDYFQTPIKTIDALGLNDAQSNLAREEIKKADRKYKLKKRGIFG
jgi:hypothetical protein|tara:strand:- start:1569 stop:2141 length:573 start_codon:yes stop_codon:yes gene_type:complete